MRCLPHWLEQYTLSESTDFYREQAISHAREGGLIGKQIEALIKRDDLKSLIGFELPPFDADIWIVDQDASDPGAGRRSEDRWNSYLDSCGRLSSDAVEWNIPHFESVRVGHIRACRQALAFFQKLDYLEIGVDKREVAEGKFLEAEILCKETNDLLLAVAEGRASLPRNVESVLYGAIQRIARVLGDVPSFGELSLRFGPGATRGTKKSEASTRRKIAELPQCSENLVPLLPALLGELPVLTGIHEQSWEVRVFSDASERLWMGDVSDSDWENQVDRIKYFEYWSKVAVTLSPAKLGFVPKNAKTDRTICVEPCLNVILQAGIGDYMAKRLAAFGIDIRDQSVNQERARAGSLTGALATLDLSSASDPISRELVFALLPLDWALLLDRARSSDVSLGMGNHRRIIRQEKFSSMGNGFTFALETLIFWSLAAACCNSDSDATAYGDDLIVPTDRYGLLSEVLTVCGFKVNHDKSFHTGYFRESCGKDYYRGVDVRPFYPKRVLDGQGLFVLHNFYWRQGDFARAELVKSFVHKQNLIFGPDGYGDGHLISDDYVHLRPQRLVDAGFDGHFFHTFVCRTGRDSEPLDPDVEHGVALYQTYRGSLTSEDLMPGEWDELPISLDGVRAFYVLLDNGTVAGVPLVLSEDKETGSKILPLPGVVGYKKIRTYILGR